MKKDKQSFLLFAFTSSFLTFATSSKMSLVITIVYSNLSQEVRLLSYSPLAYKVCTSFYGEKVIKINLYNWRNQVWASTQLIQLGFEQYPLLRTKGTVLSLEAYQKRQLDTKKTLV